ncbi:hypothetical protein ANCDUO_24210 [Ancylostoma duodenale]|uniref:Uncharacterized protein n=1 Tax=Ancylostoma duodenale TaxID=51022 RepID=A0A0C2FB04_9BILA|nr:hypothetical protein ANCDUO_24210 [Ancylostoma duodenale]
MSQVLNNDSLRQLARRQRADAERAILTAAKTISPDIASEPPKTYSIRFLNYEWCVETIKQSVHASLATELKMSKAGELLRSGDLEGTAEAQKSKIAGATANNLCMLKLLQRGDKLQEAEQYSEQSLALDHYNANALVNAGLVSIGRNNFSGVLGRYAVISWPLAAQAQLNKECHCSLLSSTATSSYESLEGTAQAIELHSQANSLAPSDPAILARLAAIYDAKGDKTQAFQSNCDSYSYHPSNLKVIEWMGANYIDAQFSEKAVNYFEKASIMQPNEIKWQLMMASSHRRAGKYRKTLELNKNIQKKFPANIECM